MRKLLFGAICAISGLLVILIMLFWGANPNAFGALNTLGQAFVLLGFISFILGLIISIIYSKDDNSK